MDCTTGLEQLERSRAEVSTQSIDDKPVRALAGRLLDLHATERGSELYENIPDMKNECNNSIITSTLNETNFQRKKKKNRINFELESDPSS